MKGEPTEAAVLEEFRAEYLYSGNASKVGRKLKLNERTSREIAQRLSDDPAFAEERRKLRAQYLDECVALRMRVANKAAERFMAGTPALGNVQPGAMVTIIDKRPDYARVVIDAEKNAQSLVRLDAERDGTISTGPALVINMPEGAAEPAEPMPVPPANGA